MTEQYENEKIAARKAVGIGTFGTAVFGLLSLSFLYDAIQDFVEGRYSSGAFKAIGTACGAYFTHYAMGTRKVGKNRLAELEQKESLEAKLQ